MNEENNNPSLHPWQMSAGQLDQEQASNKPVRALAFGLPRTTLLMGLMFVAGIVWGIHAGRQARPMSPRPLGSEIIQEVELGGRQMSSEVAKRWEKSHSLTVNSLDLPRQYRPGLSLGNPFATWMPIGAPVAVKPDLKKPSTSQTPNGTESTDDIEDAPKLDDQKLKSTLVGRRSTAIVNGNRVRVGDMLKGWKIVKIGNGLILLDWKGNKHTLYRDMSPAN